MKVLLIEPAKSPLTIGGEDVFMYEPLALEYVAAGVAADHDVRILDMRLEKNLPGNMQWMYMDKGRHNGYQAPPLQDRLPHLVELSPDQPGRVYSVLSV